MIAGPSALTLSSLPDQVARRVVFLSCLSSSCLTNSSPMNSISVSSKGPTEGNSNFPVLVSEMFLRGDIRCRGTVVKSPAIHATYVACLKGPIRTSSGSSLSKVFSWPNDDRNEEERQRNEIKERTDELK